MPMPKISYAEFPPVHTVGEIGREIGGIALAPWWRRILARAIDAWWMPLLVAYLILPSFLQAVGKYVQDYIRSVAASKVTFGYFHPGELRFDANGIVEPWMWVLFGTWPMFVFVSSIYLQGRTGRSVGKYVMGIRVVRIRNGSPPGIARSFLRWCVQRINLFLPGAIMLAVWDSNKQTAADKFAGTIVVRDAQWVYR